MEHNMRKNKITDLENNLKDNMNTDLENNQGCNIDVKVDINSQKNTRNVTVKQILLQILGYIILFAAACFTILLPAYFVEKGIIRLSRDQALYLIFGMIVFAFLLIGYLLFQFLKNRSTIKISRKAFLFLIVQGIISVLFSVWNATSEAETRLLPFQLLSIISVLVGISFNFLPKHPWEKTFVEITRRQLLFSISGGAALIFMLNFCLSFYSESVPATVT